MAGLRWRKLIKKYPNLHYCIDGMLPLGACHHQKLAVIDDEIAYSGGMDIALGRWDFRSHHPVREERHDPGGFMNPEHHTHFGPYHDLMMITAGPVAHKIASWVRHRWKLACKCEAIPQRIIETNELPQSWPSADGVDFENVTCAIARTIPPLRGDGAIEEIDKLYLDEIAKAEEFVYIENQFLTYEPVAQALNKRLRECPKLRVLAISCDRPQGNMERKSMWSPRVKFREIIEAGGVADRVELCHPAARENGVEKPVRIHSKLIIVDDKFLHIGSANLNRRSMGMDTEFDVVIAGDDEKSRRKIAAVRTDLIREHSGREAAEIDRLVATGAPIAAFVEEVPTSREHFVILNDEEYRDERFGSLARWLADPRRPFIPADLTMPVSKIWYKRRLSQPVVIGGLLLLLLVALGVAWKMSPLADFVDAENLKAFFAKIEESPFAYPLAVGIFIMGGLVFFPLSILIVATAFAFGPIQGLVLSLIGSLLSAMVGYGIGHKLGFQHVRKVGGSKIEKINEKIKSGGVAAVAVIRTLPIAPFSLVNLALGLSAISFWPYMIGTLIGLIPGVIAISVLGGSVSELWHHPDRQHVVPIVIGAILWAAIVATTHLIARRYEKNHPDNQTGRTGQQS